MERREFLKMFGLGAVAVGAAAATMSPAQAASALTSAPATPAEPVSVDSFIKDLAEANGDKGEFAQYYFYRRRYYRPRYYVRRRRCWLRATPWGWRRVCSW